MHEARCLQSLTGLALDSKQYPGFIHPKAAFHAAPGPKANLVLPVNFDSEFVDNLGKTTPLSSDEFSERTGVTVQIRGVDEPAGLIFVHPNQAEFAAATGQVLRHPVMSQPCVIGDWLEARGVDVQIFPDEPLWKTTRKTCRIQMFAHFAIADYAFLAGTSEFAEMLRTLLIKKKIRQTRRLMAHASGHKDARCGVVTLTPWCIVLEGEPYRLTLEIIDSNALHGIAGYKDLARNVGHVLESKDLISRKGPNAEISRMNKVYFERPLDFDAYAEGDLYVLSLIHI